MRASDFSLADDAPAHVYVHRGYVLDQHVTGLVRNLPAPGRSYFGLENAGVFREQLRRRRTMHVLIEQRGSDTPIEARVRCIDGAVMVLESPLVNPPQVGACVQLLLGYRRTFIDARLAEKLEKEETVWI